MSGSFPISEGDMSGFLLRYDSTRSLTLLKTIDGMAGEITTDEERNIYVSGVKSYGAFGEGFLEKYSPSGQLLWRKTIQSSNRQRSVITSIDAATDGSVVLSGLAYGKQVQLFDSTVSGPLNFIAKVSKSGEIQWINPFSSSLGIGSTKVRIDQNGDIITAGNEKEDSTVSPMIAKLDGSNGSVLWKENIENYDSKYTPWARAIAVGSDGSYVVGGEFGGNAVFGDDTLSASGQQDIFLMQFDNSGKILWVKTGGSMGRDKLFSLSQGEEGVLFTGGFSDGFTLDGKELSSKGNTDVYVGSISSSGNLQWLLNGGSEIAGHTDDLFYDEYGAGIVEDSKGRIHVVGTTIGRGSFGTLNFNSDEDFRQNAFWLTLGEKESEKTVHYPCIPSNISNKENVDLKVYPNPFSEALVIKGNKGKECSVSFYNSLGQIVTRKQIEKNQEAIQNLLSLPKGFYLLEVKWELGTKRFKVIKE